MIQKSKIILLLSIALLLSFTSLYAQPSVWVSKSSVSLGDMKEGRIIKRDISIENRGDEDLTIEAKVSCGCVKILSKKNFSIPPGGKTKLHFSFNSTGYEGKVTHYIYIDSNDPVNKSLKIPISASVIRIPTEVIKRFKSLNLGIIVSSGLIDGINPCAFTVLVFFISFLAFVGYTKRKMAIVGVAFILAVFITYVLIGFGLFEFIRRIEAFLFISQWVSALVSVFAFILGAVSLYDFSIYRKTKDFERIKLKLPLFLKEKIQETIRQRTDIRRFKALAKDLRLLASAFVTGFTVSLLESICTGQIYVPTLVYILRISPHKLKAFGYLLLYNLMFIFPLIFIFYLGLRGLTSEGFANFARKNLGKIKLITAFLFFVLGIGILLISVPIFGLFGSSKPESSKIDLVIIKAKECLVCNTDFFVNNLKRVLADLEIREIDYQDQEAQELISNLKISMLPAYFLNRRIKEREEYTRLENFLIETEKDYLYFNPSFAGASYFLERKRIPKRLDLFIFLQIQDLDKILETIKNLLRETEDIDFHLHFLAQEKEIEGFVSPGGIAEVEEYLRCLCIEKYDKGEFFDYLICRAKNINSSWWEDCAEGLNLERIKKCAKTEEGKDLLRKNIRLTTELAIFQTPVLLLYNQEIFGITRDTSVEELKRIIEK